MYKVYSLRGIMRYVIQAMSLRLRFREQPRRIRLIICICVVRGLTGVPEEVLGGVRVVNSKGIYW